MPEPFTLTTLLIAGATIVDTETVKEATKDAYRKLKDEVGEVFGPRAAKPVAKLEDAGTHEEGGKELERYVGDKFEPDEATQIQPFVTPPCAHNARRWLYFKNPLRLAQITRPGSRC
jgi:hypothetical protein